MNASPGTDSHSGSHYTMEELITLHEVEADLHEILTEGRIDASLIRWFLNRIGIDVEVYAISDRVGIMREHVEANGLEYGERGKVITFAMGVDQSQTARQSITCVADTDFGLSLEDKPPEAECLLLTDYANIESYCFVRPVMEKYLHVTLRAPTTVSADSVMAALQSALLQLFIIRWLLKNLPNTPGLVERIERRCDIDAGEVRVNATLLLRDSINGSGSRGTEPANLNDLLDQLETTTAKLAIFDPRMVMNGHDFARLLCYYISKAHPQLYREDRRAFREPNVTAATLLSCVEHDLLREEVLFQRLISRVQN